MKNQFNKKFNKFRNSIVFLALSLYSSIIFAEDLSKHSLPIKEIGINNTQKQVDKLLPLPLGDIESASKNVEFDRNPFQEPSVNELPIISNLNSTLAFKGLVQTDSKLMAIISNMDEQKFYEVGDILSNGFIIKSISLKDITVDISNGSKNYRMTLTNIKSAL